MQVVRSARRTRSVSAHREGTTLVVRIPARFSRAEEKVWVDRMRTRLLQREARTARRSDVDLDARAEALATRLLDPKVGRPVRPRSVRWVTNQNTRWGSCSVDSGEIRLSHRLRGMPDYVIDHVLLHELAHLVEPSHNARFRELSHHRDHDRAEAWLEGWLAGRASSI